MQTENMNPIEWSLFLVEHLWVRIDIKHICEILHLNFLRNHQLTESIIEEWDRFLQGSMYYQFPHPDSVPVNIE